MIYNVKPIAMFTSLDVNIYSFNSSTSVSIARKNFRKKVVFLFLNHTLILEMGSSSKLKPFFTTVSCAVWEAGVILVIKSLGDGPFGLNGSIYFYLKTQSIYLSLVII